MPVLICLVCLVPALLSCLSAGGIGRVFALGLVLSRPFGSCLLWALFVVGFVSYSFPALVHCLNTVCL